MSKLKLGDYNRLTILKKVDFGLYLDGGDAGEILLPKKLQPKNYQIGDEIEVFLYLDTEERLVATTEHPLCKVGEFAFLEVAWVNKYGAFLKWGLQKDLFCPFREQKMRMEIGKSYIVHVHIDEESYRIMASAKVEHYLSQRVPEYQQGDAVNALIWQKTDLGFKVIIDNKYQGLAYEEEIFKNIHTGDRLTAYIKSVRPDGKIDLKLQPMGHQQALDFSEELLQYLKEHDGKCNLGDKSDADDIRERFQVSKKTFKKAIGNLYKQRLITVSDFSISLNPS